MTTQILVMDNCIIVRFDNDFKITEKNDADLVIRGNTVLKSKAIKKTKLTKHDNLWLCDVSFADGKKYSLKVAKRKKLENIWNGDLNL